MAELWQEIQELKHRVGLVIVSMQNDEDFIDDEHIAKYREVFGFLQKAEDMLSPQLDPTIDYGELTKDGYYEG